MANPINLIKVLALQKHLDPQAVLAVARQEGLGGGIGDSGTSFGPWQLHKGGALPSEIPLSSAQEWAWSPAGLNYALSKIASVAGGLHGRSAIENIVRRFERPAAPDREVAGALSAYNGAGSYSIPSGGFPSMSPAHSAADQSTENPLLSAILNGGDLLGVIRKEYSPGGFLSHSKAIPGLTPLPLTRGTEAPFRNLPAAHGSAPAELLIEGTGGPTHSTGPHIHVAYTNPQSMLAAIRLAESLGLHVGENPYTGGVDPVHANNSYHYRTFPGKFNGRKLGEAIDVSGPRAKTLKFYAALKG